MIRIKEKKKIRIKITKVSNCGQSPIDLCANDRDFTTSNPLIIAKPDSGSSKPDTIFNKVVFPAPFAPSLCIDTHKKY